MKIHVRGANTIYETRLYEPFMYKDVMYGTIKQKKGSLRNDKQYKYHIVHVLTGQYIIACVSEDIENNIKRLREAEIVCKKTIADALTEKFGDDTNANINADQWNKLITRLEK